MLVWWWHFHVCIASCMYSIYFVYIPSLSCLIVLLLLLPFLFSDTPLYSNCMCLCTLQIPHTKKMVFGFVLFWVWLNMVLSSSTHFLLMSSFILLYERLKLCCVYAQHFLYPFICWWTFVDPVLAVVTNAIHTSASCWLSFLWVYVPRSGTVGWHGHIVFSFFVTPELSFRSNADCWEGC